MGNVYLIILAFVFSSAFCQNPSDRDYSFNPLPISPNHYFVENSEKSMALADGKALVIANLPNKFIKLDGNALDNDFSVGTCGAVGFNATMFDFVLQPDGKILVCGLFDTFNGSNKSDLVRLNADGTVDESFTCAITNFSFGITHVAVQPDGKILITGDGNYNSNNLRRLNADGSIDNSFSGPSNYRVFNFAQQADGKIVMIHNQMGFQSFNKVARLNSNGTLDNTFTEATFTQVSSQTIYVNKILIQSDNKIVVAGRFWKCNSITSCSLIRLTDTGSIDLALGTIFSSSKDIKDVLQQTDGKLVIASNTQVERLNQVDLSVDQAFINNAIHYMNFTYVHSVSLFPDQKILASGQTSGTTSLVLRRDACGIVKINPDGTRDTSFINFEPGFYDDYEIYPVIIGPDGKIWAGGFFYLYNGKKHMGLARLNPDGSDDTTLNYGGLGGLESPTSLPTNTITGVFAIAPLSDGKAFISGRLNYFNGVTSNNYVDLIKINSDGTKDNSFTSFGGNQLDIKRILPLPNGNVLALGSFPNNCPTMRLFSSTGSPQPYTCLAGGAGRWAEIQGDGKILFSFGYMRRTNADLTLDTSFVQDPLITNSDIKYFEIQPDGKIIINGTFTINGVVCSIARLLSNGTLDPSFNFSLQNSNIQVMDFALLPDQKIIINYLNNTNNQSKLIRLNTDGSVDSQFSEQIVSTNVTALPNGKILLHNLIQYQGQQARGMIRIMGDSYYFLQGQNKLDQNANGCDDSDPIYPYLKIKLASASDTFDFFTDTTGYYKIGTIEGNYTITPTFENPSYYTATPSSIGVSFPATTSPVIQNFCIAPNGIHNDLEITILPITPARPGFDADYKILYKNKGNQIQSGSISMNFNDAVLDYVSASPAVSGQSTNVLNWNFSNLNPFESRAISVRLNINSPVETPAVTAGNILDYNVSIISSATDEMPADNSFQFPQTVVNSYDPNDKTCLEGASISTAKVGDYVHYLIRFENTGTFAAQNITVKDIIDTTKYDINTLVPLSGSHSFTTRITDGCKVSFYFENINLPFENATNDGYVAFKIKTKSTLVAGDTFRNSAGIFFDYNPAIVTHTAVTTVEVLAVNDFQYENYLTIYPNPVTEVLHIDKNANITLSSISIYNAIGQLVRVEMNAAHVTTLDVSELPVGNYIMKVLSDKGISTTKFVKK